MAVAMDRQGAHARPSPNARLFDEAELLSAVQVSVCGTFFFYMTVKKCGILQVRVCKNATGPCSQCRCMP